VIKRLFCRAAGHRVNRRRVWHDRFNFRTSCERCGAPMLRDHHGWREFDSEHDASVQRQAHPHSMGPIGD